MKVLHDGSPPLEDGHASWQPVSLHSSDRGRVGEVAMEYLWTWSGRFFGYREGDLLYAKSGRCVGRFSGSEVYGSNGKYLGELIESRLITNRSKRSSMMGTPAPNTTGANVSSANLPGYAMYAGHEDFPDVS